MWKFKEPRIAKITLEKNKVGGLIFPSLKTNYQVSYRDKAIWYWPKGIDQWNRIGSPEINTYVCSQLICNRMPRPFNEEGEFFEQMMLGQLDFHMRKNEVGLLPHTIYRN